MRVHQTHEFSPPLAPARPRAAVPAPASPERRVRPPSPAGCKLVTPDSYYNTNDAAAAAAFKEANATMYDGADAVFVGFGGDNPKDILFS